ncbi:MAG: SemiSWEET family sugar transporter [Candidatus Altarchaeaceae archaeon]
MNDPSLLGIIAGIIVLTGFIPQIYKGYRTKKLDDLSYYMVGLLSFGMFLWVIYGVIRNDIAIILTNVIGVSLNLILIFMKFYYSKKNGKR